MKRPGKKKPAKFSSSNKKVLTGPCLQIEITKIDNFAKERLIKLKLKTRPEQLNVYQAD